MLEQETDTIIQSLSARTIADARSLSLKQILATNIPKGIQSYFRAEVVRLLNHDLYNSVHFARIDFSAPGMHRVHRHHVQMLATEYVFPREEFLIVLDHAVHFLENYLCRPQWTIEQFVFDGQERIPTQTLLVKLEYLSEYGYFPTLIKRVVQQKQWTEISASDFRSLIRKIDEQIVRTHTGREKALLAKPIFDFLLLEDAQAPIALKPLLVFYEDKKLIALKEHIEGTCQTRSQATITLSDLGNIIEEFEQVTGKGKTGQERPEMAPDDSTNTSVHSIEDSSAQISSQAPPERSAKNPALSLTYAGLTEKTSALPDLLFEEEQRKRFVDKIFKNDGAYFLSVIAALNKIQTLRDSSRFLHQLFETNGLDPAAEEVTEFTEAVYLRFAPEQKEST